jgi:RimJ/RimL family protein N-acetyltransferase
VVILTPDQWESLRSVRLRALEDSPESFASHLPMEAALTEQDWRDQISREYWILAHDGESQQDVGMLSIKAADPSQAWLVRDADCWMHSCWIAPEFRGRATNRTATTDDANKRSVSVLPVMMSFVDEFCQKQGWQRQGLGVFTENIHAIKAYERFGYEIIGDAQPSRKIPGRKFVAMFKNL